MSRPGPAVAHSTPAEKSEPASSCSPGDWQFIAAAGEGVARVRLPARIPRQSKSIAGSAGRSERRQVPSLIHALPTGRRAAGPRRVSQHAPGPQPHELIFSSGNDQPSPCGSTCVLRLCWPPRKKKNEKTNTNARPVTALIHSPFILHVRAPPLGRGFYRVSGSTAPPMWPLKPAERLPVLPARLHNAAGELPESCSTRPTRLKTPSCLPAPCRRHRSGRWPKHSPAAYSLLPGPTARCPQTVGRHFPELARRNRAADPGAPSPERGPPRNGRGVAAEKTVLSIRTGRAGPPFLVLGAHAESRRAGRNGTDIKCESSASLCGRLCGRRRPRAAVIGGAQLGRRPAWAALPPRPLPTNWVCRRPNAAARPDRKAHAPWGLCGSRLPDCTSNARPASISATSTPSQGPLFLSPITVDPLFPASPPCSADSFPPLSTVYVPRCPESNHSPPRDRPAAT